MATFRIGFVLFPRLTQLDLTGPFEILSRMRDAETLLVAKTRDPVPAERGLSIVPTATFADCPPLDLICVPGGIGVNDAMGDPEILAFIRKSAEHARYVTSVCTGSLVLGAAGLLRGRRAASHWLSREALRKFGAEPSGERVVVDGNVMTGGGVTAGIDFALRVVEALHGKPAAETIQLMVEYDPDPPFAAGSPERAPPDIVDRIRRAAEPMLRQRDAAVTRAAQALGASKI
jgi:cyclohexyl-isocyanide hydratase